KIQTIHAFCEAVLHRFPLEANIAGHFTLIDASMEARLMEQARRELLAEAVSGADDELESSFRKVLDLGGETGFDKLMGEIVANRDKLSRVLDRQAGEGGTAAALRCRLLAGPEPGPLLPDPYFDASLARSYGDMARLLGKKRAAGFAEAL